jgi:diguanylate cyclase (GGDEF)-like protein/PAS domain S-box-containing protein
VPNPTATVLAVDDNATIRKAISLRLGSKGYDVVTAPDGKEALELIEQKAFDLMLLDLQMPGMAGEEVLRRVRRRFSETELPVIMLAASDDKNDISRSLDLGANDYVIKPGDLPLLLARIKTQLSLKRTAERLREHEFSLTNGSTHSAKEIAATLDQFARARVHEELLGDIDSTEEFRYHVIYDNTPMPCFTLNGEGEILFANRFGLQFLGYQRDEVTHRSILEYYAPEDRKLAAENLASVAENPGRLHRWDIRRQKKGGTPVWVRETARAIGTGAGMLILMTCEDIDDTYKLTEKLSYQASHDELTGLANRKVLEERLSQVIESAQTEHTEHTLAMFDIDQFKIINDTCGHTAGDELLRQMAKLLGTVVRKRDTLARLGGDEFAVLIEDCAPDTARKAVDTLRQAVESFQFMCDEKTHRITVSIGIVAINQGCENVAAAMSMADTACFAAKDSGRNRIHAYQMDDLTVVTRHGEMRWATRINDALLDDRFELNFQRITPLTDTDESGDHYELLIRMRDELGNIVLPGEFLPAAERYNLADKLDRWVIGRAFGWLTSRPDILSRLYLCGINLSGQSMGNEEILHFILEQIDASTIPADKLCFEITETAAIADLAGATHFISTLKDRGCMFALDDFGSGFSSFSYLKRLPVDFLKIDGCFVRDIVSDSIDLAMVRSINEIGHVMGKKTIAEFVEDSSVLQMLRTVGVDYAQGYEIGRPTPIEQFSTVF